MFAFYRRLRWTRVPMALLLAISLASVSKAAKPGAEVPHVDTYTSADGQTYFAMSLTPTTARPESVANDLVILFDTSASQTGDYRLEALAALETLLASLGPDDRVQLMAADLGAVPLTDSFVEPMGDAMNAALDALRARAPLGATEMLTVLDAATERFAMSDDVDGRSSSRSRGIIYLGDGVNSAQSMPTSELEAIVDKCHDRHVSISSFAIGPHTDNRLLAVLANHTGGMLAIDYEGLAGGDAGAYLAEAVSSPVVWPTNIAMPPSVQESYPRRTPPLRFDRDTILVGTASAVEPLSVTMSTDVAGAASEESWMLAAAPSNDDFNFLPELVAQARRDEGLSLPTVGSAGLNEVRRMAMDASQGLARLSAQAAAVGSTQQAEQLAARALAIDPGNPEAQAVRGAVTQIAQSDGAAASDLRLIGGAQPEPSGPALKMQDPAAPADPLSSDGALLNLVEREESIQTEALRTEVRNLIDQARGKMTDDPAAATSELKLILEEVRQSTGVNPDVRSQLASQIESVLQTASREQFEKTVRDIRTAEIAAQAQERRQINEDLFLKEAKLTQLMARVSSLMDEERYLDAENVALTAQALKPMHPGIHSGVLTSRTTSYVEKTRKLRDLRQRGVVDVLNTVEEAHIPTPDEPPIVYPPAETWQLLTARRAKWKSVSLESDNPRERKILQALDDETEAEFPGFPLTDVLETLKAKHEIEIVLDRRALEDEGINPDEPVDVNLRGVSLRSALRIILHEHDLTYAVRDEVLMITTTTAAEELLTTRVYPVADLVIPIQSGGGGGLGGLGGGGLGGGGGGFGGGGGGGFGGGGGGFGGGGLGGGGGGFFSVPADADATTNSTENVSADLTISGTRQDAPFIAARTTRAASSGSVPAQAASGVPVPSALPQAIQLDPTNDPAAAWQRHFATHQEPAAAVRETVRQLFDAQDFDQIIAVISAALANGQSQPWMYETLGLAMELGQRPRADVERALMSSVDFTNDPDDLMYVAQYMARLGSEQEGDQSLQRRALKIFRQVAETAPMRPEPLVHGMRLAKELGDVEGIRWAAVGILSQPWPESQVEIWKTADAVAQATLENLREANRHDEANRFAKAIADAKVRDCAVVIHWNGDADLDLQIEEPSGTVCSYRNARTTAGGVIVGDGLTQGDRRSTGSSSEVYVCPQGFDGTYRIAVRRVWGEVTAGKVTVDVYTHYNTDQQQFERKQLDLVEGVAIAAFDLDEGRRTESLEEQQVANAVSTQVAVGRHILAQQINAAADPRSASSFFSGRQRPFVAGIVPIAGGAVGFMPVIQQIQEGAIMSSGAVISADRRYVRINPTPLFSGIGEVNTFNFATGQGGTSAGGGAAGGSGIGSGGLGGGIGGGGAGF